MGCSLVSSHRSLALDWLSPGGEYQPRTKPPIGPAQCPVQNLGLVRLVGARTQDTGLDVVPVPENLLQPGRVFFWARGVKVVPVHRQCQVMGRVRKVAPEPNRSL